VKTKSLLVFLGIFLSILMIFGLLPSCGGGSQPAGTGVQPAQTAAGQVFNWRYQSTALAGTPTYWLSQEYVDVIKKVTGGRLIMDLQPQGGIVGSMEIFDAVATDAIESGASCD